MARLPYVDPAEAPPHVREVLETLPPLNLFRMVAHAQSAVRPLLRLGGALLTEGELDDRLRELAILRVAQMSGAEYEWVQHVAIGQAVGVSDEEVAALEGGDAEADCFGDGERLVLAFTTEVVRDVGASQATFDRVAERFSPREVMELILTIGFYMMVARVMETTELDIDPPLGTAVIQSARSDASD
jgi:4-carboxymuconolactone decarboxylase